MRGHKSLLWCKEYFNDIDIYYLKKNFFGVESHIYDLCTFLCVFHTSMKKEQHRTKVLMIQSLENMFDADFS